MYIPDSNIWAECLNQNEMNNFEAEKIVTCSLIKHGAFCRTETIQPGLNNLIVTWKSTIWRVLVRTINKDLPSSWPTIEEIKLLLNKAVANNQTLVIAFVHSDNNIEYRSAEDGRIIRQRCIIKIKKFRDLSKAYNDLNQ